MRLIDGLGKWDLLFCLEYENNDLSWDLGLLSCHREWDQSSFMGNRTFILLWNMGILMCH